jgi:hypothetical protein
MLLTRWTIVQMLTENRKKTQVRRDEASSAIWFSQDNLLLSIAKTQIVPTLHSMVSSHCFGLVLRYSLSSLELRIGDSMETFLGVTKLWDLCLEEMLWY